MSYETHKFFCLNCGQESMPLPRKQSLQKERFHRKRLWCIHCQQEINHIECKNSDDVAEFKSNFEKGLYKNEAQESLSFMRNTCVGKIYMGK